MSRWGSYWTPRSVSMPSTPGLCGMWQPPELGREQACPSSVPTAYSSAGEHSQCCSTHKMVPDGPWEKHVQRPFCLGMHPCRGRECYAWHARMGFQPTQVQTSFALWERGRWQERKPSGQDAANIQAGRALLWNEHAGRGMHFRNVVVNETPKFILKWKIYENSLIPEGKKEMRVEIDDGLQAWMMWNMREQCGGLAGRRRTTGHGWEAKKRVRGGQRRA